jgi:FkbM family methyltransferase
MLPSALKSKVREVSVSLGLYRPGVFSRMFDRRHADRYQQDVAFYRALVEPEALCFDVGAHVGEQTESMLAAGCRVVAFEPQPSCVKELNARCRPHRDRLRVSQSGVGAKAGEATFFLSPNSVMSSFHQDWGGATTSLSVPIVTLDEAIVRYGVPDYCKIDVEGWELEVLKGLTQPVPLLSFEFHPGEREVQIARDCLAYLSRFGTLTINVTPAESTAFHFEEWKTLEDFLALFPQYFRDREGFHYGDIFVRTKACSGGL